MDYLQWRHRLVIIARNLLALMLAATWLMPFLWMFSTSLRIPSESFRMPPDFFPTSFNYKNYISLLTSSIPFFIMLWNSLRTAIITTLSQLVTCSMAAYAFARLRFRAKNLIFGLLMATLMVPMQVTIIPLFIGLSRLSLTNTGLSLVLPYLSSVFGIFLLRQFFLSLPKELDESAKIDGAGYLCIFIRILLPQCTNALAAFGILSFLQSWNNYFVPLIFIRTWERMTLPLGIASLQGYMGSGNLSELMAGVTIAVLPITIVFIFSQRYFIEGITMSGIKD